ncbi:DUF4304 domain-containing protein [Opitutus sp. GAS368]|uniref:DUF4304 domain-containing protein n=1 Tax=Opitutus sp. GAS368 TaxID=1882749 RepID=UPI000B894FE6|nr:DUF4304 domain-containing protein [Opitutus sp. GAS368]
MAIYKKALLAALSPALRAQQFKKLGATWVRDCEEVFCVLNVQTSQWSELYYFNVGVSVKALFTGAKPSFYDCHFGERIPQGDEVEVYGDLADFSGERPSAAERIERLADMIPASAVAWFSRHDSAEKLRARASDSPKTTVALRHSLNQGGCAQVREPNHSTEPLSPSRGGSS